MNPSQWDLEVSPQQVHKSVTYCIVYLDPLPRLLVVLFLQLFVLLIKESVASWFRINALLHLFF